MWPKQSPRARVLPTLQTLCEREQLTAQAEMQTGAWVAMTGRCHHWWAFPFSSFPAFLPHFSLSSGSGPWTEGLPGQARGLYARSHRGSDEDTGYSGGRAESKGRVRATLWRKSLGNVILKKWIGIYLPSRPEGEGEESAGLRRLGTKAWRWEPGNLSPVAMAWGP